MRIIFGNSKIILKVLGLQMKVHDEMYKRKILKLKMAFSIILKIVQKETSNNWVLDWAETEFKT